MPDDSLAAKLAHARRVADPRWGFVLDRIAAMTRAYETASIAVVMGPGTMDVEEFLGLVAPPAPDLDAAYLRGELDKAESCKKRLAARIYSAASACRNMGIDEADVTDES